MREHSTVLFAAGSNTCSGGTISPPAKHLNLELAVGDLGDPLAHRDGRPVERIETFRPSSSPCATSSVRRLRDGRSRETSVTCRCGNDTGTLSEIYDVAYSTSLLFFPVAIHLHCSRAAIIPDERYFASNADSPPSLQLSLNPARSGTRPQPFFATTMKQWT